VSVDRHACNRAELAEAVRGEFGAELTLPHGAHHRLTPNQAAERGGSLEPYDPFWLEVTTPGEDWAVLRRMRGQATTPTRRPSGRAWRPCVRRWGSPCG
jgi:L-alanine-DL-glutamate epimerase-like enolase superfamily enzyme